MTESAGCSAGQRDHAKARKARPSKRMKAAVDAQVFYQYLFHAQLNKLRHYAHSNGVELMGDLPIFVALDVWAHRELFQLNADGTPTAVAGVPPDLFEDGQLWGNPLYDWDVHQADGFAADRTTAGQLAFCDIVRIDHFRGFESYWSVLADEVTARNGRWIQSPGLELFSALQRPVRMPSSLPKTSESSPPRSKRSAPLADCRAWPYCSCFGGSGSNPFLPHNVGRNYVIYSGTHDNETSVGWYAMSMNTPATTCAAIWVSAAI